MPKSREQLHIGAPFHRDMWGQHCSFQKMRILVSSIQGTPSLRCWGTWNAGRRLPGEPGAVRPKEEDGLGVWSSWMHTDRWALPATAPLWSVLIRVLRMTVAPSALSSALREPLPCRRCLLPCLGAVLAQGTGGGLAARVLSLVLAAARAQGQATDRSLAPASPSHAFSASPAFAVLSFVGHTNAFLLSSA